MRGNAGDDLWEDVVARRRGSAENFFEQKAFRPVEGQGIDAIEDGVRARNGPPPDAAVVFEVTVSYTLGPPGERPVD